MKIRDVVNESTVDLHDSFDIELGDTVITTGVIGFMPDGIVVEADSKSLALLGLSGALFESVDPSVTEERQRTYQDGDRVKLSPEYADTDPDEIFTVSQCDYERNRCWISDRQGRGWYTHFGQLRPARSRRVSEGDDLVEAKYQGREVSLGKPMAGDVKKSKVYVKGPKGNVVKVNFGDKTMRIKKSNPKRRKSFRARHNCDNPGPRWKARYWSCRAW